MRESPDEVDELAALDVVVQAMDLVQKVRCAAHLREAVEKEMAEDVWPT